MIRSPMLTMRSLMLMMRNPSDEDKSTDNVKSNAYSNIDDLECDLEPEAGVVPPPPGPAEGCQPGGGTHPLREVLPETNKLESVKQIVKKNKSS